MVSNIYYKYAAIAFISWQLAIVIAGNMPSTPLGSNNKSDKTYPALELIAGPNNEFYFPPYNFNPEQNTSTKFSYFCPPEKQSRWQSGFIMYLNRVCLFLVKTSDIREKVLCDFAVEAFFVDGTNVGINVDKCGRNGQGIRHRLQLEIFKAKASIGESNTDELLAANALPGNLDIINELSKLTIQFPIYSFCFNHDQHETIFVKYTINSTNPIRQQMPKQFDKPLIKRESNVFGLQEVHLCYKKENQSFGADFADRLSDLDGDYLVEQMLVPWDDMTEEQERGSTKNYVNISPQWESLREDWNNLNMFVKEKSKQMFEKSMTSTTNHKYVGFDIMCGTYGKFEHIRLGNVIVDEQERRQRGLDQPHQSQPYKHHQQYPSNDDATKTEPLLKQHPLAGHEYVPDEASSSKDPKKPNITLTASRYWWKFITYGDKGIVLIMPNIPKSIPTLFDNVEPLCEDICETHRWQEVKRFNKLISCCQATEELLAKLISPDQNDVTTPAEVLTLD